MLTIAALTQHFHQPGTITWIGIRPVRSAAIDVVDAIEVTPFGAITGDRYKSRYGKRQVTLIQAEHLSAIASILGITAVDPALLRRNIAVKGINLLALKGKQFSIGSAILEFTGLCHPCSRMEEVFGEGGYNAVRGHGGITASVVSQGIIAVGDSVEACQFEKNL
ncbi:MAG: MOSC domain-containing protein YiiM [Pseudohongiellaceae bacterium]|jgi:MOSC domain-containing protein YiiM